MYPGLLLFPFAFLFIAAGLALSFAIPVVQRRLGAIAQGWILAIFPLAAFGLFIRLAWGVVQHGPLIFHQEWLPTLGLSFVLHLDGLSALFALLVTGIGTPILFYTGYYFQGKTGIWRFLCYLLLFMTAMLGLVLAGDMILLFIFWEATSLLSFLLISYDYPHEQARQGAFKSLFLTGSGGVALLVGLLLLSQAAGSSDLTVILAKGDFVRAHPLYPVILLLIALGAFTKSAQIPFHIWLPDAMTAPTPASAFLHSATMVKAGIYLLARLHPILGLTDLWFWVMTGTGLATMITGAFLGLRQVDLKRILAYSTISQLGVLVSLLGQDTSIAFKALVISILAHALYKSALFLLTGIIDHETGTRDLRNLGGLAGDMPRTALVSGIAALSMGGLPPLFGFLAKETLLATATHPNLPTQVNLIFPGLVVIAGAMLLVQAGIFFVETFLGEIRTQGHEPALGMLLAPALPSLFSLAVGLLPEPQPLAEFLAKAAQAAFGSPVKVSLALWTGISVPLVLSVVAVTLGSGLFLARQPMRQLLSRLPEGWTFNRLFGAGIAVIDGLAELAVRIQTGALRRYLVVILLAVGGCLAWFAGLPSLAADFPSVLEWPVDDPLAILQVFTMLIAVAASLVGVFVRRDLLAIFLMSASGLAVAVSLALEPAPDASLVQIVVDILVTVILVLCLARLPRPQRERAAEFTFMQSRPGLLRDGLVALGSALVMFLIVLSALATRPRFSQVTGYYQENAKTATGSRDIVGAIVIDFRGFDTLLEITVFSLAGIGVYTLLRFASRKAGDVEPVDLQAPPPHPPTRGIGGLPTSPLLHLLGYVMLPLSLVIALIYMMYGHDQPGDGFAAGVILSLGEAFWYVVFGYSTTHRRLIWIRPGTLIPAGLFLGGVNGILSYFAKGHFMAHVDYGKMLGLPLPAAFHLSSSFLFEMAICLAVLGGSAYVQDIDRAEVADKPGG